MGIGRRVRYDQDEGKAGESPGLLSSDFALWSNKRLYKEHEYGKDASDTELPSETCLSSSISSYVDGFERPIMSGRKREGERSPA